MSLSYGQFSDLRGSQFENNENKLLHMNQSETQFEVHHVMRFKTYLNKRYELKSLHCTIIARELYKVTAITIFAFLWSSKSLFTPENQKLFCKF